PAAGRVARPARPARDAAALAPGGGPPQVGRLRPAERTGPATAARRRPRPDRPAGHREPTLGLPAHPRRAAQAGPRGLGHGDSGDPAAERRPAGSAPGGVVLA